MRYEGETRISINRALDGAFDHLDELPPVDADFSSVYIREWEKYKPERNGIGALLMRNSMQRSLQKGERGERGPFGVLDYTITPQRTVIPKAEPLQTLPSMPDTLQEIAYIKAFEAPTAAFIATYSQDSLEYLDRLQAGNGTALEKQLFLRMHVLTYGYIDFSQGRIMTKKNVHHFLGRILTAGKIYQRAAIAISMLLAQQQKIAPRGKEVATTLRNSYPLIMLFANDHVDYTINAIDRHLLQPNGAFNRDDLMLEAIGDEQRALTIHKSKWRQYKEIERQKVVKQVQRVTTGCLAMASENKIRRMLGELELPEDTNVIKDSLNWYADLVEAM